MCVLALVMDDPSCVKLGYCHSCAFNYVPTAGIFVWFKKKTLEYYAYFTVFFAVECVLVMQLFVLCPVAAEGGSNDERLKAARYR